MLGSADRAVKGSWWATRRKWAKNVRGCGIGTSPAFLSGAKNWEQSRCQVSAALFFSVLTFRLLVLAKASNARY